LYSTAEDLQWTLRGKLDATDVAIYKEINEEINNNMMCPFFETTNNFLSSVQETWKVISYCGKDHSIIDLTDKRYFAFLNYSVILM
jgi:hypothetical protein